MLVGLTRTIDEIYRFYYKAMSYKYIDGHNTENAAIDVSRYKKRLLSMLVDIQKMLQSMLVDIKKMLQSILVEIQKMM